MWAFIVFQSTCLIKNTFSDRLSLLWVANLLQIIKVLNLGYKGEQPIARQRVDIVRVFYLNSKDSEKEQQTKGCDSLPSKGIFR